MLFLFWPKSSAMCRNLRCYRGETCKYSLTLLFPEVWKLAGNRHTDSGAEPAKTHVFGQNQSSSR